MQEITEKSKEKKLERFRTLCKQRSIKLTPQRMIIYEALIKTEEHPSTDMVYQQIRQIFPTISFDTVNRTLLTFYEMGLAGVVEGSGNPKRFDGNVKKHHHFQCLKCRRIVDIYNEQYDEIPIPQELQQQYNISNLTVHLEGICDQCKADGEQQEEQ